MLANIKYWRLTKRGDLICLVLYYGLCAANFGPIVVLS
jgi:hypothetical protein